MTEDFHFKSMYENILGQGKFSEVRKLRFKTNNRFYAVKTFRVQQMQMYDKLNAIDLENEFVWSKITKLRQMNHPNLPVFKWVYHTRPSYFRDKVCYDSKREFHFVLSQEREHRNTPELEQENEIEMVSDDPLDPLSRVHMRPKWRERPEVQKNIPKPGQLPKQMTVLMENQRDWIHLVSDYYPEGNLSQLILKKVNFREHELVNIIRGILAAITYCHFNLNLIIANLNPEGIVCEFNAKEYHTRVVSFNHSFAGPYKYVRQRVH